MKIITIIFLLIIPTIIFAQNTDSPVSIEDLIEEIAQSSDDDLDYSALYEDLNYFMQHPLNLNKATRADLEKIQFLNDFQIEGILEYQRKAGKMITIYELQLVSGFSKTDIYRILPFVTVKDESSFNIPNFMRALKYGRHSLFLRTQFITQKSKGYSDENISSNYLGNRMKYYTRYQFNYQRKIQFGFVAEKDPGEQFFTGTQKYGFDYYTGHIELKDIWKFRTINVGDFQAKFGQGLIMWSGLSSGKSSYVMDIRKKYQGIRKYSSSDENKFLRGFGTTARLGDFDITGFVSYKHIDGNIDMSDTLADEQIATSFQQTGMHRTVSENDDRKSVSEFVYGANTTFAKKHFKIGASFVQYFFGAELNKNTKPYNQFDFQGSNGLNASIDYQANYHNFYFFGEGAVSKNGSLAFVNGMLVNLAPQIKLSLLHRNYQRDYQAYYGAGFAESSATANENGMYLGTEIHPYRNWTVSAYFDTYTFPWLKFRTNAPSEGIDYFTQILYNPSRYIHLELRFKQETKKENSPLDYTGVKPVVDVTKKQLRFHATYRLSRTLTLKNRIEVSQYHKKDKDIETGFLLYQDVSYRPRRFPLVANFRFGLFDAAYDARIYSYENDILYGYSIPGYSGRGIRTYLTLKYTIIDNFIDIWLRYAQFHYTDRDVIGSGKDEIDGSNKTELKFQVRIKF